METNDGQASGGRLGVAPQQAVAERVEHEGPGASSAAAACAGAAAAGGGDVLKVWCQLCGREVAGVDGPIVALLAHHNRVHVRISLVPMNGVER